MDALSFTPDGNHLVVANHAHACKRWDWRSGRAMASFVGHGDFVSGMVFVDEQHLVTASCDGGLRLWNAVSGACLGLVMALTGGRWVALAPDGRFTASDELHAFRYGYRENSPAGQCAFRVDLVATQHTDEIVRVMFAPVLA